MQVNFDDDTQIYALWVLGKTFLDRNDGRSAPDSLVGALEDIRYAVRACERALRSNGWQPQPNGDMINTASLPTRGGRRK